MQIYTLFLNWRGFGVKTYEQQYIKQIAAYTKMGKIVIAPLDFNTITPDNYPAPGTFIIAIDETDGVVKTMDSNGIISPVGGGSTGSGSYLTEITYAELLTLYNAGTMVPGKYKITDKADKGIIVEAISATELAPKGIGLFLNPDFQDVGNYSGVASLTGTTKGFNWFVWGLEYESQGLANGDIVFYNGLHYQVTNDAAFTGVTPGLNVNETITNLAMGMPMTGFQYGISGNHMDKIIVGMTYTISGQVGAGNNNGQHVISEKFFDGSVTYFKSPTLVPFFNNPFGQLTISSPAYTLLPKTATNVGYVLAADEIGYNLPNDTIISRTDKYRNYIGLNSDLFQWGNEAVANNSGFGGQFNIINQRGAVNANTVKAGTTLVLPNTHTALVQGNTFGGANTVVININNSGFNNCEVYTHEEITFSNSTYNYDGGMLHSNRSTFEADLAIEGINQPNMLGLNYVGIVHLTTANATESIIGFKNFSQIVYPQRQTNIAVRFYAAPGTIVTFYTYNNTYIYDGDTLPLKCENNVDFVLNGDNGDWIELTKVGNYIYQTGGKNY